MRRRPEAHPGWMDSKDGLSAEVDGGAVRNEVVMGCRLSGRKYGGHSPSASGCAFKSHHGYGGQRPTPKCSVSSQPKFNKPPTGT